MSKTQYVKDQIFFQASQAHVSSVDVSRDDIESSVGMKLISPEKVFKSWERCFHEFHLLLICFAHPSEKEGAEVFRS